MLANELFENTLKKFNIGFWELGSLLPSDSWSKGFIKNLGYKKKEIEPSLNWFLQYVIKNEDAEFFEKNYQNYKHSELSFRQKIKLKNADGVYLKFVAYTVEESLVNIKSDTKLIFFQPLSTEEFSDEIEFHYHETAMMSHTGSWFIDFKKKKTYWDPEAKRILGYPSDYSPSLKNSKKYFSKQNLQTASDLFLTCTTTGKAFSEELQMNNFQGKSMWIRCIGKPVYGSSNTIIGLKGVFQNIDEIKRRELTLQKSVNIIASQNNRLFNFAHIVSHNLRSHSSNLSLLVQLIESIDDASEKLELVGEVKNISKNLSTTIEHLNEIVTIHANKKQKRKNVNFKETLVLVMSSIRNIITSGNAEVHHNFDALSEVRFVPAYMESILLNLLTNAIKYKHPDRDAKIHFESGITEEGKGFLKISDNGQGIDMEKFGDKVFGMYKTFHHNTDAVGIGLFITKNQIESQNGSIEVESEVGVGTTFTIGFH